MLTRRQLLSRATTTLLLVPLVPMIASCGVYGSGDDDDDTNAPACGGVSTTSTVDAQHTHALCVPTTDLTAPPAGGVSYHTTVDGQHDHVVTLTAAQLAQIESGATVTVTSSNTVDPLNNQAHTHGFTIQKTAAAPPPPRGGNPYPY